jgi:predicted nucleotidyltransferase/uncharacterized protein with HEPN domain
MAGSFELPRAEVDAFCRKWKIERLELFGSAARGELRPDSDIDFLVTWDDDAHWSLFDHAAMEHELGDLLGRKVDLVDRENLEKSSNHAIRDNILHGVKPDPPPGGTWRDVAVLIKLRDAAVRAESVVRELDAASFAADEMTRSVVMLQLIRIGAATERLSDALRAAHPEIAWEELRALSALGSQMPDEWDLDYVWFSASQRVPTWLEQLDPLMPTPEQKS